MVIESPQFLDRLVVGVLEPQVAPKEVIDEGIAACFAAFVLFLRRFHVFPKERLANVRALICFLDVLKGNRPYSAPKENADNDKTKSWPSIFI